MNDSLNIETILGHVANEHPLRACRDGKAFEEMLPIPAWSEETVIRNGSVRDTVSEMKKIIRHYSWQTKKIAPKLQGKDLYDTCHNIWNFLYTQLIDLNFLENNRISKLYVIGSSSLDF